MKQFLEKMYTKALKLSKKPVYLETGIFFIFLLLFILLNWRLFAIGSENQLFLYGDNLSTLNNLFYLFNNFKFLHPFETLIGQNGMLGSYPMAEPQNSIFYLPIFIALLFYKAFHFGAIGLYYELLVLHSLHFLIGVFFIYKISHRIFKVPRSLSFISGIVYLGLGWNAAWFGTATLSYMIGIIPLVFYVFFWYLQTKTFRWYILFILSLILFLYAGGIVNFFFYLLLNFFLLFSAFVFLKYDHFFSYTSKNEVAKQYLLLFIVAPLFSLFAYSVQLFTTYQVSADISHSGSSYDYLAFFGLRFYDLIGFFIPKFGLLGFGSSTNPQLFMNFSSANSVYVGFLTIIIVIFGVFAVKSKDISLFVFMLIINLALSFGGAFFLYDATYFFPGNSFFRGHYKYLMFVGIYLTLIIPIVLRHIQSKEFDSTVYKKIIKYVTVYVFALIIFAIISGFTAFAVKVLERGNSLFPSSYYPIALTFSNYFLVMIFIGIIFLLVIKFFVVHPRGIAIVVLALAMLLDTSLNFKYAMQYKTKMQDLVSTAFFKALQGKTVVNDVDKYTQLYQIPEIVGVDPLFQYTAIPNKYLVEYNSRLKDSSGGFHKEILKAAGIDGVLTNKIIDDPDFNLASSKSVNKDNYTKLYLYNANGDIHNDWGEDIGFSGQNIRYYSLKDARKTYFTNNYREETKENEIFDDMSREGFTATTPILLVDQKESKHYVDEENRVTDVSFLENKSTYKKIALHNESGRGLFFINIPYSSIWQAKVNGIDSEVYRANYAFSGVKVNKPNAVVEIYIDTRKHIIFLILSIFLILMLVVLFIFPRMRFRLLNKINI